MERISYKRIQCQISAYWCNVCSKIYLLLRQSTQRQC